MHELALFLQLSFQLATPLLFATLGEIITEKAGNMNLGVEGQMMVGACFGYIVAYSTGNAFLALVVAVIAGAALALVYAMLTVSLLSDQLVCGFAITIFGTGFANFAGKPLLGTYLSDTIANSIGVKPIPVLSSIPFVGTILFDQSWLLLLSIVLALLMEAYLYKTSAGLKLRMTGEQPAAADASGIDVTKVKYLHILVGGGLCALGGAYLSLVDVPHWQNDITAGTGWIAIALVIFAMWSPLRAIGGAYLFGILRALSIKFQSCTFAVIGVHITLSSQIMDMMPYAMTILVLLVTTLGNKKENLAPASLGRAYYREER
ncbi:MAG: ABC transporter permease [Spirochaetia bacterium]|jgi:simple sugar transport system permease protein|nr:ABC transporter permease [Spirochaetia bacterium]